MTSGLWWSVASNAAVALAFLAIGVRFIQRPATGPGRGALLAFASWWLLYALQSAITAVRVGAIALGNDDADLGETLWILENAASVLALWGLVAYVRFLYTGDRRGWVTALGVVLALTVFYTWVVAHHDVVRVYARTWSTGREFAREPPLWELLLLVGAYYTILVSAAVAFGRLARRVQDPTPKVRSRGVMWALILLSVLGFVGLVLPGDNPLGPLTGLLRIGAVATVWAVYFPTRALQRRLGIRPL